MTARTETVFCALSLDGSDTVDIPYSSKQWPSSSVGHIRGHDLCSRVTGEVTPRKGLTVPGEKGDWTQGQRHPCTGDGKECEHVTVRGTDRHVQEADVHIRGRTQPPPHRDTPLGDAGSPSKETWHGRVREGTQEGHQSGDLKAGSAGLVPQNPQADLAFSRGAAGSTARS